MKQLSDLLEEAARQDAPPLRHTVDDVVIAGKRRTTRRNFGWASVAAVAVAAAIGVPQLLIPRAPEPVPLLVAPATTTSAPSAAAAPKAAYSFKGYAAGRLRVADPTGWRLADQNAEIRRGATTVGTLTVYNGGVDPRRVYRDGTVTTTDPVGGHPAVLIVPKDGEAADAMLAWEYGRGAWATVAMLEPNAERDARQVAEAFRSSPAYDVTIPLRAGTVPPGYQIMSVTVGGGEATVLVAPAAAVRLMLLDPDRRYPSAKFGNAFSGLVFELHPRTTGFLKPTGSKVVCETYENATNGQPCAKLAADGRYVVEAHGPATSKRADAIAMLGGVTVADPADPSTWYPLDKAFPASAQPYRD
ncbi:hypothetical protein [Paractinoplanes atraurantiacus]|uniref:Uncharacterized protein n=1 Tax=Paractinoplanes atraurantiacus TaxID=1036182 RepID=A0A285K5U8_9ACTN|nr:hypothetical protein [Actinoplanes atraurantiacus]SNY67928.1 hypothetical protein SAMN05421748_13256 [Actinoplanes atraurantiacus]